MATVEEHGQPVPEPAEAESYEAPCVEDVDTESQPAATAALNQTNPG